MPEYVRVKQDTGTKFSKLASAVNDSETVLKQDAVDIAGNPLPPEYPSSSTATSKSSEGA